MTMVIRPAADDFVTPALRQLARNIATYVPGVGHVYDQTDGDPSPLVLAPAVLQGGPVVTFTLTAFDFSRASTTTDGRQGDGLRIEMAFVFGCWGSSALQPWPELAIPFVYRARKTLLEHNKLGGALACVWNVKPLPGSNGWYTDPAGTQWWRLLIPVDLEMEYAIARAT